MTHHTLLNNLWRHFIFFLQRCDFLRIAFIQRMQNAKCIERQCINYVGHYVGQRGRFFRPIIHARPQMR